MLGFGVALRGGAIQYLLSNLDTELGWLFEEEALPIAGRLILMGGDMVSRLNFTDQKFADEVSNSA